ncbi:DUF1275 domain-containing protein [Mycolicibacterium sp. 018/SC-01/001]|uniref:YoaK family protein n=1 Tax=Mycolicibacterium sp. 018/SC-01/001 TaxID=2592069 RepID=UPI00117C3D6C|nr:YoaK family protein [Mycolicibacterium sp. 018/SC-01/001]TRW79662.1 DUF1275 domain-containing protein [Mycolicibacterium sp. 018/SC-01/001]
MTLTFVTGALDAVGYLGLDRVFTGNMTGNIVILGMGVASEDELPVAGPLAAFVAYMSGAAIAGYLLRANGTRWSPRVTGVFVVNALVLTAVACLLAADAVMDTPFAVMGIAASIALLMGAQAATARVLAVADMTTVVVTSTITAFASETLFAPGFAWLRHRRLWAIVAIFLGALTGALTMKWHVSVPVFGAAAVTAAVAAVGHWQARST